jgi:hypothetical protein
VPWHDARFANVHSEDADLKDDKDALGHGSFAHNIAHIVGHHIGHHIRHVFKGHHSREHAHKELEKHGYTHERSFATSGNSNNRIHVGYYSHPAGHKAEVRTEEKVDENGNQLTSESSVKVQEAKKQQKVNDADFDESKHPRDKLGKFTDADLKKQHEDYQSQMKNKNISTQKFYSLARKRDEIYNEIKRRSESKSSSKISQVLIDPKVGAAKAIYNSVEKGDESSSSAVEKFSQEQKKVYKDLASASSLSKKETDALKTYTSDKGYKEINAALRSGKSHPLVSDLDKVASSVTLKKDLLAYRGLLHGDGYKAGKPFTEKSYMSLSMDYDTARSFSTGHADELAGSVVEFLIPAGTKIGFGKKSESEIILPRNTSGEIDAKKYVMQSGQSTILTGRLKKRAVHDAFDPNQPRDKDGRWSEAGMSQQIDKVLPELYKLHEEAVGHAKFTADENAALNKYVSNQYISINKGLRAGRESEITRQLDSAISKTALPRDVVVYRGIGDTLSKKIFDKWDPSNKKPIEFIDKAFVSTTARKDTAKKFSRNVMEIRIPKGTSGMPVPNGNEYEIVLGREHKFRVVDVKRLITGKKFVAELVS